MNKTLVMIIGPPAVGKTTVGAELSKITGFPLFHAHLSIEAILPVFDFGTAPFNRLVTSIREGVFSEVVNSDLPGLIYTYVWAFSHPGDLAYVQNLASIFESAGGRVVFAELKADLGVRLDRNEGEDRLAAKQSKRDVKNSRKRLLEAEEEYQLNSDGDFPLPEHILIDNTSLDPETVAHRIADHFSLLRTAESGQD